MPKTLSDPLTAGTRATAPGGPGESSRNARPGFAPRALNATPAYWFSMLAASALGTNLGDFRGGGLWADIGMIFALLVAISCFAIWSDRRIGRRTEAGYWVAIVVLRAAATNLGDFLTHNLALGYVTVTVVLGLATLLAGAFTHVDTTKATTPTIDRRYWTAMFIAGVFGTVGGDLVAHLVGLYAAAGLLCVALVVALTLRDSLAPTSVLAYWCVILAERCAGTPVGDALASHRAIGLGLPLATACTCGLLVAGLLARRAGSRGALAATPRWRASTQAESARYPDDHDTV